MYICEYCINKDFCKSKKSDDELCVSFESETAPDDASSLKEETKMTAAFDLSAMLGAPTIGDSQITQIPCDMLLPYHNHKFEMYTGERLDDMVESIKENGVLVPIIVQPAHDGKYEILIGHNRWNASKLAGLTTVPAVIKNGLSEDEAEMYVIESNLMQRGFDDLKISEQAAVVAMRHSQMFSQGKRNDILRELALLEDPDAESDTETLSPVDTKLDTNKSVGEEYGLSRATVARLIRIDKLTDSLKQLIDNGVISVRAGVNLSYLSPEQQNKLSTYAHDYKIDINKSQRLRTYSQLLMLDDAAIMQILTGQGNSEMTVKAKTVKIGGEIFSKYFSEGAKKEEISETIEKALEFYFANAEDAP